MPLTKIEENIMSNQPNFNELMKKAEEMQTKMKAIQEKITAMTVEGSAGADLVTIQMNGQHKVKASGITIHESLLKGDVTILQHLIAAAINDASNRIESGAEDMLAEITNEFQMAVALPEETTVN